MLRQRNAIIDWFLVAAAAALTFVCMSTSFAQAQPGGAAPLSPDPILTAQLPLSSVSMEEPGIEPKAMRAYQHAIRELHRGKAASAEKGALRAFALDQRFANAEALAATAALTQRQFSRASDEATNAAHIDPNDVKAWVILATADNYLGRYAEAADALSHVRQRDRAIWQVGYQWARAEAGQEHVAQALEWANRASLTAPQIFAPLHLLRASALLAASRNSQAADELETYLQLLSKSAPERDELRGELERIRESQRNDAGFRAAADTGSGYNALAN